MDLSTTLKEVKDTHPLILLSHNPDVILRDEHKRAALIISGHTHGGQFRLPLIGAIAPIPNELGRRYDRGIFTLDNGVILAITQGMGETMARARIFCPPEILMLKINLNDSKESKEYKDPNESNDYHHSLDSLDSSES
jgi:predicted MPP superfamily phosphohydrolase